MESGDHNRGRGRGRGYDGGDDSGRVGNYPHHQGPYQASVSSSGGDRSWVRTQTGDQRWGHGPGSRIHAGGASFWPHQQRAQGLGSTQGYGSGGGGGGGGGGGSGRGSRSDGPWRRHTDQSQPQQPLMVPQQTLLDPVIRDIKSLAISEQNRPTTLTVSTDNRILPIKRPDKGGMRVISSVRISVNHFPVKFNPESTILHYIVDIKPDMSPRSRSAKKSIPKSYMRLIKNKLFSDYPMQFPEHMTAYDGERNLFSATPLPTGHFNVELSLGEDMKSCSYIFSIKYLNELKFSKLKDYLSGKLLYIPRDILQGMDLVMKENPCRHRISIGRSFYSKEFRAEDDLKCGIAAFRGFQESVKLTSQGPALCLDYSVLTLRKRMPVLDFLKEHIRGFQEVNDVRRLRREVTSALKGLKVNVTHRVTTQKYTIVGLSSQNTRDLKFTVEDPQGKYPRKEICLVEHFRHKYNEEIIYKDIPCLDLGKSNRQNCVPMEFCVLAEGQRYPKEHLDKEGGRFLKKISMAPPRERKNTICDMMRAEDGPCGDVTQNFGIVVDKNMTRDYGRVMEPPNLKIGNEDMIRVDKEKCDWNLVSKSLVVGKPVKRWALIDFSSFDRCKLNSGIFIENLRNRCRNLGVEMEEPVVCRLTGMHEFSGAIAIQQLLESVVKEANRKCEGWLQIIICVMTRKHTGRKHLKWVSETQIGVMTQCCISSYANEGDDQYFANLALKINAKLGGSNIELIERLPHFEGEEHVMFVGADVNHPGARNTTCPSIAAVVATINWPAANRYAARIHPQEHRKEKIVNFGIMCLELVNTYSRLNKTKPKKILIFRDGVSEGQFDMVLNEELVDIQRAIYDEHYRPTITLVVTQKRHQTRLFLDNERDGVASANVPPGTVVDHTIVHPFQFDFYLCSHYGSIGTSKPTHYHVLWDENNFTSDHLQKLIYHSCFTFARCTKPVTVVPPVHYADLVAFRGREYQEVVKELLSPASASFSSSGKSPHSSSAASLDKRYYKLHPHLENEMFFV